MNMQVLNTGMGFLKLKLKRLGRGGDHYCHSKKYYILVLRPEKIKPPPSGNQSGQTV